MKRMNKILALALALMLMLSLAACGKTAGDASQSPAQSLNPTDSAVTEQPVTSARPTQDRTGAEISLPETVKKIVVLAPSIAETLMDLGCTKTIVAVDTQTQAYAYPELSADLPAFDMMAPDTEALAALEPDVIFVSSMTTIDGADPYADLKKLGICVVSIPSSESIEGVKEDILFVASCVDKTAEGEQIVEDMTAEIERIAAIGATVQEKKTVYFEIAAAPYAYSFGNGTFLNEMIELIGATNVFADQQGWLSVETESAIAANPDVILTNVNYLEDAVGEILSREGWNDVTAVANQDVHYIDNQASSLPNEHIVKALQEIAAAVYPDLYTAQEG